MSLKQALIFQTLVSVVADTMLLPFYPQFFAEEFGNTSPEHVGLYIAACCFTVMVALPLWAKVARRVNEFPLWVMTQLAAGTLAIAAWHADSLVGFWAITQAMLAFKASYLLIYPFVMRLEEKDRHLGVAGLFSVLIHFGAIGGALLGAVHGRESVPGRWVDALLSCRPGRGNPRTCHPRPECYWPADCLELAEKLATAAGETLKNPPRPVRGQAHT